MENMFNSKITYLVALTIFILVKKSDVFLAYLYKFTRLFMFKISLKPKKGKTKTK